MELRRAETGLRDCMCAATKDKAGPRGPGCDPGQRKMEGCSREVETGEQRGQFWDTEEQREEGLGDIWSGPEEDLGKT